LAKKKALIDIDAEGDQEGVMDSLLEALKTGSAFNREKQRKRQPRVTGAARQAQLNRSRSRNNLYGSSPNSRKLSLTNDMGDDIQTMASNMEESSASRPKRPQRRPPSDYSRSRERENGIPTSFNDEQLLERVLNL